MKRLLRWILFLGWTGLWLWSVLTEDPNQPWRQMFSLTCFILAGTNAFKREE